MADGETVTYDGGKRERQGGTLKQTIVDVAELSDHLSHYLRLVKAGETVEITEGGVPIGRIVTTLGPSEGAIEAMVRLGLVAWNGQRLPRAERVARVTGRPTVADLLIEDRS
jgi:prevent-host-death family protein